MTEVEKSNQPTLSIGQLQGMLETMQPNKTVSLTADMLTMEPGEELRAIFTGMCEMKKMNSEEMGEAVELLTKDGMVKSADKVLVSTLRGKTAPMAVFIECTGWEQGKGGKYRGFNVYPLEPGNGKPETKKGK